MKDQKAILDIARKTIDSEAAAIENLSSLIDADFAETVSCILQSEGRVVISGIGKSAIIASKIVATMNSTGTPAIFMHAADAIHGDLGTIQKNDVVICISKSGNTPEIKMLVPLIQRGTNTLIGMTGNMDSFLAEKANFVLNTFVEKEACPNNLAPTTSTTAQLVMGDALAICLLKLRGFSSRDFAKYHPGGTLGKKLYLTVGDITGQNLMPRFRRIPLLRMPLWRFLKKCWALRPFSTTENSLGLSQTGTFAECSTNTTILVGSWPGIS